MKKLKSILLVDDDPSSNFIHRTFIQRLGICDQIFEASNGAEALSVIEKGCLINGKSRICDGPELILLDLNMPVMDGFTFLEKYKNLDDNCKKSKIIILSSSNRKQDISLTQDYDMVTDYLIKPLRKGDWEKLCDVHGH